MERVKYQQIDHCHRVPAHGKPDVDEDAGTATCLVCGWTGKLRKDWDDDNEPFRCAYPPRQTLATALDGRGFRTTTSGFGTSHDGYG